MKILEFSRVWGVLLLSSMTLPVHGAWVEFFKEANFKGDKLDFNSSSSCTNLPPEFLSYSGSVKTTSCIVFYSKKDCSDVTDFYDTNSRGYVHVIKSKEDNFRQLNFTYRSTARHDFQVKSLRDCTEIEGRPQADFDYYEKKDFAGQTTRFRDICTCTSLPTKLYDSVPRSANTFGNCFEIYNTEDGCSGKVDTLFAMQFSIFYSSIYFIKPCYVPEPCKRYTATILNFQPISDIQTIPVKALQVQKNSKQIINNGSMTQEHVYDVEAEFNESFQIDVPDHLKQLTVLNFTQLHFVILQSVAPVLENSSSTFKTAVLTALQNLQSGGNESLKAEISTKTIIQIKGKSSLPPCTINEVRPFVEVTEIEIPCRLQFHIVGNIRNSEERLSAKDIQRSFENLNVTDNGTAIAETIVKLKFRFRSKSWANITHVPVAECRQKSIELTARVINLTVGQGHAGPNIQQQAIATKEIFKNNGTTQQEDNYEAARRINETAKFQFPEEVTKMKFVNFAPGLKPGIEVSNPFISRSWTVLQSSLTAAFKNHLNTEETILFEVQEEKEYRVQRRITVSPCTKYEVSSFIELVENFEIPYQVQLEITGMLGSEIVKADEIQNILEDITVLRNKDIFTVIAQTTAQLSLTYGVGSGIDASGSPILDCRGRFIKFGASIVNLELLKNESNSTTLAEKLQVSPKLVFINNSTTQQEKQFEASKEIKETAHFVFSKDIAQLHFIRIDESVESKLEKAIPFLSSVWTKLKGGFVPNRSNWNETISFGVQNEKEFRVLENLVLAPCMRYDVSAFIEIANDVEVSYRVLLEATAKLGSEAVGADEIRSNLKDMTLLHDKDDFTVVAETTMKLRLNYGLGTGLDNAGTQMLDCMEIQAALVANCKFTCSG